MHQLIHLLIVKPEPTYTSVDRKPTANQLAHPVQRRLPTYTSVDREARTNQPTHLLIEIPQPTNLHELLTDARTRSKITIINDTNLRLQYIPTAVEYVHLDLLFRTNRINLVIL